MNSLNLMLAIQRAEQAGFAHLAQALCQLLKRELAKGRQ